MGVADTNPWRFRKDELETVTLQTLETHFYIFGTHIFSFVFPRIIFFWWAVLKGGG